MGSTLVWREFVFGAIAGAFGEGALHPIDTIKTRIQTQAILSASQATISLFLLVLFLCNSYNLRTLTCLFCVISESQLHFPNGPSCLVFWWFKRYFTLSNAFFFIQMEPTLLLLYICITPVAMYVITCVSFFFFFCLYVYIYYF